VVCGIALAAGIVAAHLLDEPLGVLSTDEDLERVTQWEVGREGSVA
jgi:hypothetical protein